MVISRTRYLRYLSKQVSNSGRKMQHDIDRYICSLRYRYEALVMKTLDHCQFSQVDTVAMSNWTQSAGDEKSIPPPSERRNMWVRGGELECMRLMCRSLV